MCPVWHSSPMRWYSLPACWQSLPACWHSFGFGLDMDRIWFLSAAPKQAPQQGLVRKLAAPKPRASHHQTKGENLFNPRAKTFRPWFQTLRPWFRPWIQRARPWIQKARPWFRPWIQRARPWFQMLRPWIRPWFWCRPWFLALGFGLSPLVWSFKSKGEAING